MGKPIIGLVGGIGSGKSVVAKILADCGCGVIDADKLAHEFLEGVVETIQGWWGESVVTEGRPDRGEIAKIVFSDSAELKRLEDLLYPLIAVRQWNMIEEYDGDDLIQGIVLDAPKLYEAGANKFCNAVIFVKADRETRISRVVENRGWTESQFCQREIMQKSVDEKEEKSDYVIENNSDFGALRSEVERVFSLSTKTASVLRSGKALSPQVAMRSTELDRLLHALAEIIQEDAVAEWLETSNEALDGFKPLEPALSYIRRSTMTKQEKEQIIQDAFADADQSKVDALKNIAERLRKRLRGTLKEHEMLIDSSGDLDLDSE